MKVQHLTALGTADVRDTADILPTTVFNFKNFETGKSTADYIKGLPLFCKITIEDNIAIFNLQKGNDILFVNVCCFNEIDSETAFMYVKKLIRGNPLFEKTVVRKPSLGHWLYTIPVNLVEGLPYAALAGEIELYIFNSIRIGLKIKE